MKFISLFFFFILCNAGLGQNNSINESDLIGCWKYYPEESEFFPDIVVYRPCDYESFPSIGIRGRFKMNLRAKGKCSYLKIRATDGTIMMPGKWTLDSSTNELEIFDLEMDSIRKYKIVRLEKGLLGIKKTKHNTEKNNE